MYCVATGRILCDHSDAYDAAVLRPNNTEGPFVWLFYLSPVRRCKHAFIPTSHRPTRLDNTVLSRRQCALDNYQYSEQSEHGRRVQAAAVCHRLNLHHPMRRDATKQFCRVGSGSVKWLLDVLSPKQSSRRRRRCRRRCC